MQVKFHYNPDMHCEPYGFVFEDWPTDMVAPIPLKWATFDKSTLLLSLDAKEGDLMILGMVNRQDRSKTIKICYLMKNNELSEVNLEKMRERQAQ